MGARPGTVHSPDGLTFTRENALGNGFEKRGPHPERLFAGASSASHHGALNNAALKLVADQPAG